VSVAPKIDHIHNGNMADLIYKDEVFKIVGAAMAVYNELGFGFPEAVYQEALEVELAARDIPFVSQQELRISYRGQPLQRYYVADIVAYGKIIVELKAISQLTPCEQAQLLNYLKATGFAVGLLVNFGNPDILEYKRMVLTADKRELMKKKTHLPDRRL
jgi:GxxExxY protein